MTIPVVPIPRGELDDIGMRFAAEVVAAMDDTLAEMLDGVPDRLVAAAWRDAFRRNPRIPSASDAAAIPTIWRRTVNRLSRRVFRVFARSAIATRDQSADAAHVPDDLGDQATVGDWRDLITAGTPLIPPRTAGPVMLVVRENLTRIGDDLWVEVTAALQAGSDANESVDEITARIADVLDGAQASARRIARTEITRAANAASLAQMIHSGYRGNKVWGSNTDNRVRPAHLEANGQARPLPATFDVAGTPMMYPGDPSAPPDLVINCRCDLTYALSPGQELEWMGGIGGGASAAPQPVVTDESWDFEDWDAMIAADSAGTVDAQSNLPAQLKQYWLSGEGAVRVRWGTEGSFDRCVNELRDDFPANTEGLCANLYHEATGFWPGADRDKETSGGTVLAALLVDDVEDLVDDVADDVVDDVVEVEDIDEGDVPHVTSDENGAWDGVLTVEGVVACGCDVVSDSSDHTIVIRNTPPKEWFSEPRDVDMHGALTVTDEGRVYGLLAPDGVAHRSYGDRVVTVPLRVDYKAFMGGETIVAGGGRVVTGPVTMGCGHASTNRGVDAGVAMEHYDNTCSVVANIVVGENTRGVWVAGALRPGVTPDQVVTMMGCRLSGDWRPHRRDAGRRELTAALLVPVPGFAEARARASVTVASGAMVASSIPVEFTSTPHLVTSPRDVIRMSLRGRVDRGGHADRVARRAALIRRSGRD